MRLQKEGKDMGNSIYQFITFLMTVLLVIWLWPLIQWLIIFVILFIAIIFIRIYFYQKKVTKEFEKMSNESYQQTNYTNNTYQQTSSRPNVGGDVIDVDYVEREIKDDE